MDFSTLSIGQRIGIKCNHRFAQFPYRIGQIEGETPKYWIIGIDYYSKTTGKIRGKDSNRCLVPYEEAAQETAVLTGGAFSVGDAICADANGKAVVATTGKYVFGRALEESTGGDKYVLIEIRPEGLLTIPD